jgi:trehalose 6-phosphate synthase
MNRLIVLSNRCPEPGKPVPPGGLAIAIQEAFANREGIWIGWSGTHGDTAAVSRTHTNGITYVRPDLPAEDYDGYYNGFANGTLWPLCHDRPSLMSYSRQDLACYRKVNRRFAELVADIIQPGDLLWVHDYHLFLIAAELRAMGFQNRMGFFQHVPFPLPGLLAQLPCQDEIVLGLADYDLVGFQTESDRSGFTTCLMSLGALPQGPDRLSIGGRTVQVACYPIGIDAQQLAREAATAPHGRDAVSLKRSLQGRAMILGVDRLDYSKGIGHRFAGFESFLQRWPDFQKRVVLTQIAPPSREDLQHYKSLRRDLERHAGSINSRFADVDWTPLRYITRAYSRRQLAAFYRFSRVGLVTPFRDGMNLVAKEFVACQDPEDPGVLILSKFSGAAQQMKSALLINPIDPDEIAEAMFIALSMPLDERRARWLAMKSSVWEQNIAWWRDSFLAALAVSAKTEPDWWSANGAVA